MSQKLSFNPSHRDAAKTLAVTEAAAPGLANRREIPLSSFDFLGGAYAATKRARTIALGVLALLAIACLYKASSAVFTGFDVSAVRAEVVSLESEQRAKIDEFGETIDGADLQVLLERDAAIASALNTVTKRQGDLVLVMNEVEAALTGMGDGAAVSRVELGADPDLLAAAAAKEDAESKSAVEDTTKKTTADAPPPLIVTITITGKDIATATKAAERVMQTVSLLSVSAEVRGREVVVKGTVKTNSPPSEMLERMVAMGVRARSTEDDS